MFALFPIERFFSFIQDWPCMAAIYVIIQRFGEKKKFDFPQISKCKEYLKLVWIRAMTLRQEFVTVAIYTGPRLLFLQWIGLLVLLDNRSSRFNTQCAPRPPISHIIPLTLVPNAISRICDARLVGLTRDHMNGSCSWPALMILTLKVWTALMHVRSRAVVLLLLLGLYSARKVCPIEEVRGGRDGSCTALASFSHYCSLEIPSNALYQNCHAYIPLHLSDGYK
ncbi:hypothetical protein BC828DRAFT_84875 [Blastocladiella britannica]|nr:hypothetical protein BC828DRAFT_84875 [Blastocladiella britannica]